MRDPVRRRVFSSASNSIGPAPGNNARSPPTRICRKPVGECGAVPDNAGRPLRIVEIHQAGLGQRIDRDDPGPAFFAFSNVDSIRG